jgi:hypothetical protein
LSGTFRLYDDHQRLQAPHQEQDQYDNQQYADDAAGRVTPTAGMRPGGNDTEQKQDEDNQQYRSDAHETRSFAVGFRLPPVPADPEYP